MEAASRFAAIARLNLPFYEYAGEFCKLAAAMAWDDVTLNHLFWLGANFHYPVDLPDTSGLSWREGIFRCLGPSQNQPAAVHGSFKPTVRGEIDATVRGPRKPAAIRGPRKPAAVRGSFTPAVCGPRKPAAVRGSSSHAAVCGQSRPTGSEYGKPACSEYGKPACSEYGKPAGGSCGKPAGCGSFQARARSSTALSRARSSTVPSSASPSNALSCTCASRAPLSARLSPYFPQGNCGG